MTRDTGRPIGRLVSVRCRDIMPKAVFQICPVRSATDLEAAVQLFEAYASSLGIDLAFQDYAGELAVMPGKYAAPAGELLLARDIHGEPLGCVGLIPAALWADRYARGVGGAATCKI
jgi:hypothetical protein